MFIGLLSPEQEDTEDTFTCVMSLDKQVVSLTGEDLQSTLTEALLGNEQTPPAVQVDDSMNYRQRYLQVCPGG